MGTESREGQLLAGKYQLAERLGAGGTGEVYRALNVLIGRLVAIKILLPEHAKNAEVSQRFMREARAANLVRHENVVDVLDMGHDEQGTPFIVQELLEGVDLKAELGGRATPLPPTRVLDLLLPVIDAVAFAHQKGVVHRDLKPANVFLARQGGKVVSKLLDFGISQVVSNDDRITGVGVQMGTPKYMSPEQVRAFQDIDARSDVWSLGVILYQLLSGKMPFDGSANAPVFLKICAEEPAPIGTVVPDLDPRLSRIIVRCLRKPREERYSTAMELAADLRAAVSDETQVSPIDRRGVERTAEPTPAVIAASSFAPDLPVAPSSRRQASPGRPSGAPSQPRASSPRLPGPPSQPRLSGPPASLSGPGGDLDFDDEQLSAPLELAVAPRSQPSMRSQPSIRPSPSSRGSTSLRSSRPDHRESDAPDPPDALDARRVTGIVFLYAVVAAGFRALLSVSGEGWPLFAVAAPSFRALPTAAGALLGAAVGIVGIVVVAGASRITPFPWGSILACLGCVLIGVFAAGSAFGVMNEPNGEIPNFVPLAGALIPLGVGLFGLQQIWGFASKVSSASGVGLAVVGLFAAFQLARAADVQPAPPAGGTPETTSAQPAPMPEPTPEPSARRQR